MFHSSSECITLVCCFSFVFEKWGRFLLHMGAAREIGPNEVISLLVWRGISWVDGRVCCCYLLLLLSFIYAIYCVVSFLASRFLFISQFTSLQGALFFCCNNRQRTLQMFVFQLFKLWVGVKSLWVEFVLNCCLSFHMLCSFVKNSDKSSLSDCIGWAYT